MADSDDEYDRKRRDKFRGERAEANYRGTERVARPRDEWSERDSWSRPRQRDYRGGIRDRGYSPSLEPTPKRVRHDFYGGGGVDNYYNHYGAYHQQPHREPPSAQIEGQQPPMMSFKAFLATQDDNISDSDAIQKYNDYKLEFQRQQLNEFFVAHKDEEWFRLKYHPEESVKRKEEQMAALKRRVEVFLDLQKAGKIEGVTVDCAKTNELLKLLDTVVIKLEGGTEEDLALLEQEYEEMEQKYRELKAKELDGDKPKEIKEEPGAKNATKDTEEHKTNGKTDDKDDENRDENGKEDKDDKEDKENREKDDKEDKDEEGELNMDFEANAETEKKDDKKAIIKASRKENKDEFDEHEPKMEKRNIVEDEKDENTEKIEEEVIEKQTDEQEGEKKEEGEEKTENLETEEEKKPVEEAPKKREKKRKRSYSRSSSGSSRSSSESEHETEKNNKEDKAEEKETEKEEEGEKTKEDDIHSVDDDSNKPEKPRSLHKTTSIFLRNLAPTITRQEIEAIFSRYDGFLRVALADPHPERRWLRRGWVTFKREVNVKDICYKLSDNKLRDCELGAIVNRDLSRRIRPINGITAHKQVVRSDIRISARVALNLDKKAGLWLDAGDKEKPQPTFGLVSNNPVLHNITDYLIEEASAEEEELLGLEPMAESQDVTSTVDRDETLISVLDRIILYLRIVHSVDYYNHCDYPNEDEMPNRCGILHARGPPPTSKTDMTQFIGAPIENKMLAFLSEKPKEDKNESKLVSLALKDVNTETDKFVQANTRELAKDKWLCPLSGKKFKGPDFVRKHIFNKHAEKIEEVKKEVEFFNNYLKDSKRPMLAEAPQQKREEMPSYGGHSFGGSGYGGPGYGRPPYFNQGFPQRSRGYQPRTRGAPGDFRPVIHYRDLDAPREPDEFI